ncbi:hypothetical protein JW897_17905 [Chromobacterium alkanivorans]|uniref:hypothetical protein n=1 Tax=Chromobacterium alkanivorans TaxID=1071719 RepID=UPI001967AE3D|nr:hypothetical protein [Chromobacterium alkanivorans]MBN3005611.1 hypothetical protein [Chromobacterium alkanivorans]
MSKPRKKYNPRKVRRGWAGESDAFVKAFTLASTERLAAHEINSISLSMLAPLDVMRTSWCPVSFNMVAHVYRVARIVATEMDIQLLAQACDDTWRILNELYATEGKPVPTAEQWDALRFMADALLVLLPEIPRPFWVQADESSRETVKTRMLEQYLLLPEWARRAAIDVLAGKTVKDLAANLKRPEKDVSEHVRSAGAILYTLHGDGTLQFPDNVTKLRKLGAQLLPVAALHEKAILEMKIRTNKEAGIPAKKAA